MKLYRGFLIAFLTGTFAVVGCGDDDNGGASGVCAACDARQNECEEAYNVCISEPDPLDECDEIALLACEVVL